MAHASQVRNNSTDSILNTDTAAPADTIGQAQTRVTLLRKHQRGHIRVSEDADAEHAEMRIHMRMLMHVPHAQGHAHVQVRVHACTRLQRCPCSFSAAHVHAHAWASPSLLHSSLRACLRSCPFPSARPLSVALRPRQFTCARAPGSVSASASARAFVRQRHAPSPRWFACVVCVPPLRLAGFGRTASFPRGGRQAWIVLPAS